jgi:hypothetical protein
MLALLPNNYSPLPYQICTAIMIDVRHNTVYFPISIIYSIKIENKNI